MIKRILIKKFYRRGFPTIAIQAAKKIVFGMRDYYLDPLQKRFVPRPIPVCTKFYNYHPSVGSIFRQAWSRVLDDPVLSQLFPTAPFPAWHNHPNLKNTLSYKKRNFWVSKLIGNLVHLLFKNLIGHWLENAVIQFKAYCVIAMVVVHFINYKVYVLFVLVYK